MSRVRSLIRRIGRSKAFRRLGSQVFTSLIVLGWFATGFLVPPDWFRPPEPSPLEDKPLTPEEASAWRELTAALRAP